MGVDILVLDKEAKTPPQKSRSRSFQSTPGADALGTPQGHRRSVRIRQMMVDIVKEEKTITTPRGSTIHSMFPKQYDFLNNQSSPRRVELDQFKRRLQFKSGARSNLMLTDAYKSMERKEKMKEFHEHQRGKRNTAQFKSRGLSLPAISKTRQTSVAIPPKEGEAPKVEFVVRRNLRPRPKKLPVYDMDMDSLLFAGEGRSTRRSNIEKRMSQYKQVKSHGSFDFTSWNDRDEAWRTKRLANYMSTSKMARETTLFKKRNLSICGWGNPVKNLGNYLSICWEFNPDLDADKDQTVPDQASRILNKHNAEGVCVESGVVYMPLWITNNINQYINGYCFTIQSELAFTYEAAQKTIFDRASELVQRSFYQYNMDLSLDSSLDDGFTIDIFISSVGTNEPTVRGATQYIFMKSYIYVDKICVEQECQKMGIGAFLMERINKIARKRNKDILLYALGPVVGVYKKWGFEYCKEWPPIPKDIGAIMRKRIRTEGVVDSYVGLEWDGTCFS
ncbi:hypothetical protein BGZ76_007776 [Entomortierella beljakovae]|nr:hypothetical protein BGZ76_007776 [Entomortierella beljakovae]